MTTLTTIGNEIRLNTLTSPMVDVTQNPVVVAELAGGGFVAIWQVADSLFFSQDGADGAGIFGQIFDNAGNPVGSMFQVNGDTPTFGSVGTLGNQTLPTVTSLADGGFVVAWESAHVAARGIDIYGQRYDATGTRVGPTQFQVNDQAAGDPADVQNVSLTGVPSGGYLATWTQTSAAGNYEVFGRFFDAAGAPTTGNFQINTTTLLNQIQTSAVVFSDGTAIVVWQSDQDAGGGGFGIYGQRVNANGTLNGPQLQISTTTAGAQYGPSVVALDTDNDGQLDDGFVVVWTSDNQDGSGSGIFGQKYNASFAKVGGEFLINQTTVGSQASPSIVHLSSGEIVVTWQGPGANGTTEVFARRFDASSTLVAPTAVTGEVLVNQTTPGEQTTGVNVIGTTTPRALDHNVVQLSNGDLAIVWSDGGTGDVFGRLLSVNVAATDAPVVTALAKNPVFGTEFGVNRAPVDLFHTVNVTTEGGDNIDVLTLTVRNVVNGAAEKLRIDGTLIDLVAGNTGPTTNGFTVNVAVSGTTATVTINAGLGGATAAQMTTLIDGLAYDNESTTPGPIRRVVTLTSISDTNDNGTPGNDTRTLVATSSTVSPPRVNEIVSVSTDYVQQTQPPANSGALVNIDSDLLTPGGGGVREGSRYISADGRFVVFASTATNLVPGDTNGDVNGVGQDIFVRDMLNGTTERVSINDDKSQMAGLSSGMVSISANGNRVLFDRDGELWVRDRSAQTTTKVSISDGGTPVFVGFVPSEISGDGTKVVFAAGPTITGLVSGDTNNASDVFVRDLTTNTTVRVSTATGGTQTNNAGHSSSPAISNTGQFVVFVSTATNLVTAGSEGGADTNSFFDVFRKDLSTGTTIRVSLNENDLQSTANPGGGGNSFQPAISADGNLVVFNSLARLTAGDTDNLQDIYLRNISAGTTTLISNSPLLLASTSNISPAISPDGRYVSYGSTDNNAVFIFDTQTGLTSRAQVFTNGFQGEASPGVPSALANEYIALSSGFNHLVPTDFNTNNQDIFTNSIESLVLGGTIWNDSTGGAGNIIGDGIKQAGENGIAGVRLSLFVDLNNDDIPDTDTAVRMTFTSGTGDYQFNGLAPGNYIVRVDQDNFDAGGVSVALVNFPISPVTIPEPPDADTDTDDNDDNGALVAGQGASSKAISLDYGTEPTTEDGNASTNFTLDFGFMANPPPVISNLGGDTVAFTEDGAPVLLDQGANATVTDTNNTNFNGGNLTATVTGGTLQDVLSILSDTTILVSGTTVSFDPTGLGTGFVPIGTVAGLGTSSLTVTFNTNDATPAAATALIRHLNYDNTNSIEPPASRTVAVTVNDGFGAGGTSTVSNVTVNITQVNDEPTLTATGLTPIFTEGNAGVDLYNVVTANTIESGQTFASLTLTVTNVTDGAAEILRINDVDVALTNGNNVGLGGTAGSAGVVLSGTTATVTVTGATLTAAQLQTLIDTLLTYRNTSQDPTDADRVITITQVVDSGLGTNPDDNTATLNIAATVNVEPVNDEPTLTATGNNPTFTEDGSAADLYNTVTASTIEAGQTFTSMTLTVSNVTDGAAEILQINNVDVALTNGNNVGLGGTAGSASVLLSGTTATVTVTGATLTATQLQTLIDTLLTYRNTSQNPTDANRVVTITELIDSGASGGSNDNTATPNIASTVNVDPVNDAPTLDLDASAAGTGFSVQAVPGGAAVPVTDTDVNIVDPDNTTFASATFTVVNVQAGDLLAVSGVLPSNIVSSGFNAGTGVLTLTSAGAIATEAQWEQALHQVQFSATSATPGTRDVNITVNDGTASSNIAVATMVLNQPPTTPVDDDADANVVTEGAPVGTEVQIDVSSADTDVPPTAVTFSFAPAGDAGGRFAIDPTTGVVTVSALGATTIDRESSAGTYTITVRATDGGGGISDANFDITVNDVAPTQPVDGVPPDGGSVQEGAGNGTAVGIDANSTDVNGGTVTFAITAGNTGNAFAIDANGVITVNDATQINFEALTGYLLTVQASTVGGILTSTTQNFTIDVTNAAPVFNADNNGGADTVSEGAVNGATVGITANFVDPNGGTVSYSLFDDAGGRFTIDPTTGVVTVANAALLNFESNTSHNITVRGSDPSGAFNDQGFSIVVTNVAPVATGDGYAVAEDGTLSVAAATGVLGNDSDVHGGGITAVLDVGPANAASFTLNADGSFSYTPNADFNGPDSFTYHAFDGTAAGNTVTVNLTVTEANDPPTATDDPLSSIAEDSGTRAILFTDLTGNDSKGPANENGQTLTVTAVNNAIGGSVAIVAGHVEFTPDANFNGAASFDYTTTDNGTTNGVGDPKSDVGHVAFTVTSVNDAPVLGGVPASRLLPADGTALNVAPALTVGDVDSSSLTSATVRVSAGSFVGANDVLAANTAGTSITAFYDPATETLTLSGSDTLAHYQQVLASVTFDTTDTNPGNSGLNPTRTIEWQLNDGSGANNLSSIATTTINVSQQSPSDFNGDAVSDVLWRLNNGFVAEWLMSEGAISQNLGVAQPDLAWHFQDTGDFGADGKSDILWRHDNGQAVLWQMDGATILSNQSVAVIGNDWHNEGVADFNGDGKADVLWHNDSGQVALWTMDGAQITDNQQVGIVDASWHVQGLLDTGGDGKSDVLLRNDSGQVVLWTMDGAQITANQSVTNNLGLDWNIVGTGDFGGDGKGDVLLRNDSGQVVIWTMDANQIVDNQSVGTPGNEWQVQDVGDYNLDGKSDVLWRNDSGQVVLWEMNGNQIVSNHTVTYQGGTPAPIGLEWTVQNHHYDVL